MFKTVFNEMIIGILALMTVLAFTNCTSLSELSSSDITSSGSSAAALVSDESDTEAAYTSAIETLIDSANSSSTGTTTQNLSLKTADLRPGFSDKRKRKFRCEDLTSVTESFSCNNTTGAVSRVVTFTNCELSNSHREVTINGSFTNTVKHGGDGLCNADNSFDFATMVMGRDDEDAIHSHHTYLLDESDEDVELSEDDNNSEDDSSEDDSDDNVEDEIIEDEEEDQIDDSLGMTTTFINANGAEVTVTKNATRHVTFSDALDTNEDGSAESVDSTVDRDVHFVRTIEDKIVHDVNVLTTDESFVSTSAEGTENSISISKPIHTLNFDSNGDLSSRSINSGNLIVDHNLAQIRLVFGVGSEGLSFDAETCGPVSGTMLVTGYAINDDGSIGEIIGTGEVTFEEGEVQLASFDGVPLN
ncbi:hypothetical protein BVY03_04365, partial [bacterium K02(2017)]